MGPQHEVRDVSAEETTTFCHDLPAENVQEIALVIANSTHADRTHVLKGDVNVNGGRAARTGTAPPRPRSSRTA